jgi:two-component system, NtrC family, sensor histidine kinase HydH
MNALHTPSRVILFLVAVLAAALLTRWMREILTRRRRRDGINQLAELGRRSAQLAHNLKNPLTALKGSAQFLKFELGEGRSLVPQMEFVDLITKQIQRFDDTLRDYKRFGKTDPLLPSIELNAIVRQVLAVQTHVDSVRVRLRADLAESLPPLALDPTLVAQALENLLKNAFEAIPEGGEVHVLTTRGKKRTALLVVSDNGRGMNPRTLERASEEFFTTKPTGSGLGLAFVRRVVDSHRARLEIVSREGRGTRVTLIFPVRSAQV